MNVHLIRENENQNDGSYIHLYRNKQIGAWCAYGYSAYGLRLFDKQQGYMNFRSYSDCLQMPCTVTSGESLVSLLQGSVEVGSQTETYIKLKMADTINFNAYQKWLHKLKKDDPNDDAIIVTTHVSQYVPRDIDCIDHFFSVIPVLLYCHSQGRWRKCHFQARTYR